MHKSLAAAALVAGLALVGCSSNAPANVPASPAAHSASSAAAAPAAPASTPAEAADTWTKAFGSTFKWDDGVEFTLTAPKAFKPSEYYPKPQNKALNEYVIMDATLVNNTKEPLSPIMVNWQATTGDAEAEAVFDSASGVSLPTADVLPGKTAKFKVAFARSKGKEFVVSVSNNHDFTAKKGYYK